MTQAFMSGLMAVEPEWIDHNGHMNMAYYSVLFDRGVDQAWEQLGLGIDYMQRSGMTTYSAEFHICYLRELKVGERVRVSYHLIDHSDKALHSYQEMYHEDGWLAATGENLHLSIDQSGPKVAPFPADVQERVEAMARAHAALPRPERAGRSIAIRKG